MHKQTHTDRKIDTFMPHTHTDTQKHTHMEKGKEEKKGTRKKTSHIDSRGIKTKRTRFRHTEKHAERKQTRHRRPGHIRLTC